ncbi:glycoside hydrolase family 64 protein [Xanthovirga aplysinae]|uniref:glycoside hydrolase family 64 protein n=1 Tax=Xanthovirga aplysinae TaxID=2529853 RepID=UPI0012BB9852|nr:glycoside hydrolase family 64 protein [Xanthovirga aplysinae]MTI32224.1 hypothetical protein [Xanthovirga aplysinae]
MNPLLKRLGFFVLVGLVFASCRTDFEEEVADENSNMMAANLNGRLNLKMSNGTNGTFADNQVYYAVTGINNAGQFCYVNKAGELIPMSEDDNGQLMKDGEGYSNYFMTLEEASELSVPYLTSGRIFIGLGSPLYIKVIGNGFAGPNFSNPSDPNIDVYIEYVEFTFSEGGFWGNTTQVDQFGFPLTMQLVNESGMTQTVGITESRDNIFQAFECSVPEEFKQLATLQPARVLAPIQGGFNDNEQHGNYFDSYIDKMWEKYRNEDLLIDVRGINYSGRIINDVLTFTQVGTTSPTYTVRKPTSPEVFRCDGVFNEGTEPQLGIQAYVGAAFQRQIMGGGANWPNPETWYADRSEKANYYAQFWHFFGIQEFAYGFPYDDVWEQSTLVHDTNPRDLNINITWN